MTDKEKQKQTFEEMAENRAAIIKTIASIQ
jgi:hypothetical protein